MSNVYNLKNSDDINIISDGSDIELQLNNDNLNNKISNNTTLNNKINNNYIYHNYTVLEEDEVINENLTINSGTKKAVHTLQDIQTALNNSGYSIIETEKLNKLVLIDFTDNLSNLTNNFSNSSIGSFVYINPYLNNEEPDNIDEEGLYIKTSNNWIKIT